MHPLESEKGVGGLQSKESKTVAFRTVSPYRISFLEDKMTSYVSGWYLYSVNSEYSDITV